MDQMDWWVAVLPFFGVGVATVLFALMLNYQSMLSAKRIDAMILREKLTKQSQSDK